MFQNLFVQKGQRVQRLVLRARADAAANCQMIQEGLGLSDSDLVRCSSSAETDEPADPLLVALLGTVRVAPSSNLGGEADEKIAVAGTDPVEWTVALVLLDVAQLGRAQLTRRGRVFDFEIPGRVAPVLPVDLPAGGGRQEIAVQNPYSIDALAKLPACKAVFAPYLFEETVEIVTRKLLDFPAVLRLNKVLDAFDLPAPLLLRHRGVYEAFQVVIKEARRRVRHANLLVIL